MPLVALRSVRWTIAPSPGGFFANRLKKIASVNPCGSFCAARTVYSTTRIRAREVPPLAVVRRHGERNEIRQAASETELRARQTGYARQWRHGTNPNSGAVFRLIVVFPVMDVIYAKTDVIYAKTDVTQSRRTCERSDAKREKHDSVVYAVFISFRRRPRARPTGDYGATPLSYRSLAKTKIV